MSWLTMPRERALYLTTVLLAALTVALVPFLGLTPDETRAILTLAVVGVVYRVALIRAQVRFGWARLAPVVVPANVLLLTLAFALLYRVLPSFWILYFVVPLPAALLYGEVWTYLAGLLAALGYLAVVIGNRAMTLESPEELLNAGVLVIFTLLASRLAESERRQQQELARHAVRAAAIAEVSESIAKAGLNYQVVLDSIARRTGQLIGDACVIRLLTNDGQWLEPVALYHPNPEARAFMREMLATPHRVDEGLNGRVMQTGQPLLMPVVSQEQMRASTKTEYWPYLDRFGIHSVLLVPLRAQGRIIGTLGISRDKPGNPYTTDDQSFLRDLADQVSLAIANARLFTESVRQRELLEFQVAERTGELRRELEERKRAEGELKRTNEQLALLLESLPIVVYTSKVGGDYGATYISSSVTHVTGYQPEDFTSNSAFWAEHIHPEDAPRIFANLSQLSEKGYHEFEYRWRVADGSYKWFYDSLHLIRSPDASPSYIVGVWQDITEKRRTEDALRESEKKYRLIVENIDEVIYKVGLEKDPLAGKPEFVSRQVENVLGYRADEFFEDPGLWSRIVHPEDMPILRADTEKIYAARESAIRIYRLRHKQTGEYRWMEDKVVPVFDGLGRMVAIQGVARDVTARKQAEEERDLLLAQIREGRERLQILSSQLIEAQEAERRRIARELHDEIGQVLTAVKTNLQVLQLTPDPSTRILRLEENIRIVERALKQVRDLALDLRPSLLDDFGLVPALTWYVNREAERSGFTAELIAEPPDMQLPHDLETVCFRIVQEALTNVTRHSQATHVHVKLRQADRELRLDIRDDGVGFHVDAVLERAHGGGGLGLLGMQERVRLAGGEIEIESVPTRGTEIRVRYPLTPFPVERRTKERDSR